MNHNPVKPGTRRHARRMRKSLTDAELKFWNAVRAHRLMGLSFRRQMPISGYIVDFACPEYRLVVELDGSGHTTDTEMRKDAVRDRTLEAPGWTVLRFVNDDVFFRLDDVCSHVLRVIGMERLQRRGNDGEDPLDSQSCRARTDAAPMPMLHTPLCR